MTRAEAVRFIDSLRDDADEWADTAELPPNTYDTYKSDDGFTYRVVRDWPAVLRAVVAALNEC